MSLPSTNNAFGNNGALENLVNRALALLLISGALFAFFVINQTSFDYTEKFAYLNPNSQLPFVASDYTNKFALLEKSDHEGTPSKNQSRKDFQPWCVFAKPFSLAFAPQVGSKNILSEISVNSLLLLKSILFPRAPPRS